MASTALTRELILGRYRAIRPLGSGGMGHVWLTRDEETGLDVALKMVVREGKAAHRAEREARAAAALRHPRCQRIFAMAHDSDHVYIAYEYIPGCTLRQTLGSPGITDSEAVEVAAQVLEALAHAHGRGIVHRDVKPSNVLLAESDVIDARLLDFGLAQMADFDTLTAVGDIPGTLAYVSPERLTGENATAAADVWAVGVILWESLTGEHPFRGENVEGTSRQIRAGAPPIESYRPDLPQSLRVALTRALDVDPSNRPSAAELAGWLRSQHEREEKRRPRTRVASTGAAPLPAAAIAATRGRVLPAAAAAGWTGWVTASVPFYPTGWPVFLTILAAGIGLARPRLGLPVALAITFFPLANISLGLALLFAAIGVAWVCLGWRDPRGAFVLVAAPLLGPIFSLALVPLLAQLANGTVRRVAQAGAAVFITAIVAAYEGSRLPFESTPPPLGAGIVGSDRPTAVAGALLQSAEQHPLLLRECAIIMIAAAALPYVRGKGPWVAAVGGGTLIAATALAAPAAAFLPIAAAGWLTAGALALPRR